jgi:UTP--glucose-1-phosphate uridylyltransferase
MERNDLSRYGIVTERGERSRRQGGMWLPISDIVEKPASDKAPSDLAIIGRYALTPDIFDVLDVLAPSSSGEIQLTDALNELAASDPLFGLVSEIGRWDVGNPRGWVEAVIAVGMNHPDFGTELQDWLRAIVNGATPTASPGYETRRK